MFLDISDALKKLSLVLTFPIGIDDYVSRGISVLRNFVCDLFKVVVRYYWQQLAGYSRLFGDRCRLYLGSDTEPMSRRTKPHSDQNHLAVFSHLQSQRSNH